MIKYEGPPPTRAASAAERGVPVQLNGEEVTAALRRLTNWSGDPEGITRTVVLPAERHEPLVGQVRREEQALNHHADITLHDDSVVFSVRTRGTGNVTDMDIELAERIDAVVDRIGSGG